MKFVGRNKQLAQLAAAVASALQGDGRFVLIRGEPGIGKTTLLKTFLDGHVNDVDLLHGACEHLTTHRPLQPFYAMAAKPMRRRITADLRNAGVSNTLPARGLARPPSGEDL